MPTGVEWRTEVLSSVLASGERRPDPVASRHAFLGAEVVGWDTCGFGELGPTSGKRRFEWSGKLDGVMEPAFRVLALDLFSEKAAGGLGC